MKKWYLLLLVAILPMLAANLASCDDDKDLPNVDITITLAQGSLVDGTIYVVQGNPIEISALNVVNKEEGKAAALTNVTYFWDGIFFAPAPYSPYPMTFPTSEATPLGNHEINISCNVLAVDKTLAVAAIGYPVVVVADASEIPSDATEGGDVTNTTTLQSK